MITLRPTPYGLAMTAPGFLTVEETRAWFEELKAQATAIGQPFGLLVDIRGQKGQSPEVNAIIQDAMTWLKTHGLRRSCVVLDSALARMQVTRLARQSGVYAWERYLDASAEPDWEATAVAWIRDGKDPDGAAA